MAEVAVIETDEFTLLALAEMRKAIGDMRHGLLVYFTDAHTGISPRLDSGLSTYINFSGILGYSHTLEAGRQAKRLVLQAEQKLGFTNESFADFANAVVDLLELMLERVEADSSDIDLNYQQTFKAALADLSQTRLESVSSGKLDEESVQLANDEEEERRLWFLLSQHVAEDLDKLDVMITQLQGSSDEEALHEELRHTVMSLVNIMGMLGLERMVALIESSEQHLLSGRMSCWQSWQYFVDFGRAHFLKPFDNKRDLSLRELALLQSLFRLVLSANSQDTIVLEEDGEAIWQEVSHLRDSPVEPSHEPEMFEDQHPTTEPPVSRWQAHMRQLKQSVDSLEDALLILDFLHDNAKQLAILLRTLTASKDDCWAVGAVSVGWLTQTSLQLLRSRAVSDCLTDETHAALASTLPLLKHASIPVESIEALELDDRQSWQGKDLSGYGVSELIGLPTHADLVAAILNVLAAARVNSIKYDDHRQLMLQVTRDVMESGLLADDHAAQDAWATRLRLLSAATEGKDLTRFQHILETLRQGWQQSSLSDTGNNDEVTDKV